MKTPLNKLLCFVGIFLLVAVAATSCGPSSYNLKNAEEMQQVGEILKKHITEDMVITGIDLKYSDSKTFTFVVDEAQIVYVDPENNKRECALDVDLKTGEATESEWYKKKPDHHRVYKGLTLPEDFDFAAISTAVNAGLELAAEEDYKINGIGTYSITFGTGKLADAHMYFKMQHITGTTTVGRTRRTSYEEVSMKAKLDGELKD
ncbi:hypothetical protein [Dysgonomonas sp. 25]|uniref:hypothetical protein n=1 Tax=Dysgonomonas sp. 25 TaxID=2302933 RepID=UPI0013D6E2C0|nr:hypothetical protein [Dysgonomonas sp. 25]NDV69232.1 hypothetical protein [Dysgonomonas sp. 25]